MTPDIRMGQLVPGPLYGGYWRGPGILALIGAEWHYFPPGQAPADLRERGTLIVGTDAPLVGICRLRPRNGEEIR